MNLPTKITVSRIALIPLMLVFYGLTALSKFYYIGVLVTFFIAASTDYIDGYLARKNNQITDLGKFLDPIADKILVVAGLFIIVDAKIFEMSGVGLGAIAVHNVPYYCAIACTIMMSREFIVGVLRQMAAAKGVVLAADKAGKAKTMCTCLCMPPLMGYPLLSLPEMAKGVRIFAEICWWWGIFFFSVSLILTVYSGINYIIKNKAVFVDKALIVNKPSADTSVLNIDKSNQLNIDTADITSKEAQKNLKETSTGNRVKVGDKTGNDKNTNNSKDNTRKS